MIQDADEDRREVLIQAARDVRKNAYAPYSNFQVSASFELEDGRIFSGVNVENCSYGLTTCAERNALATAVGEGAKPGQVVRAVVVCHSAQITAPCGACRQVMAEFLVPEAPVILVNERDGAQEELVMKDLLSTPFSRTDLEESTQGAA